MPEKFIKVTLCYLDTTKTNDTYINTRHLVAVGKSPYCDKTEISMVGERHYVSQSVEEILAAIKNTET